MPACFCWFDWFFFASHSKRTLLYITYNTSAEITRYLLASGPEIHDSQEPIRLCSAIRGGVPLTARDSGAFASA